MEKQNQTLFNLKNTLSFILICGISIIVYLIFSEVSTFLSASVLPTDQVAPFNGTVYPVQETINWCGLAGGEYQQFKDGVLDYNTAKAQGKTINIPTFNSAIICENWSQNSSCSQSTNGRNTQVTYANTWKAKYTSGMEPACEGTGSHNGVDIIAPKGTPVFSIANGVVSRSRDSDGTLCILHPNIPYKGTTQDYISCYLHLDTINVSVGNIVTKGQQVGTVGIKGLATTYHLHFQIDKATAPFNPYWPFTGAEASNAGLSFWQAVNAGLNMQNIESYTVDPMNFVNELAEYGSIGQGGGIDTPPSNTNMNTTTNNNLNTPTNTNINTNTNTNESENTNINAPINTNSQENTNTNSDIELSCSFSDISSNYKYKTELTTLCEMGIISGYPDGTFQPNNDINRAEASKILVESFNISYEQCMQDIFPDVPDSAWFCKYVDSLAQEGSVQGYPDGTFQPANNINRAENYKIALSLTNSVYNWKKDSTCTELLCADVFNANPNEWWFIFGETACECKLYDFPNHIFQADKNVTREEMVVSIYRLLKKAGEI